MSNYYISAVDLRVINGKITPIETVLTKPCDEKTARYTAFKWKNLLEMKNLHVNRYGNGSEYRRLMSEQSKRRKKARDLTVEEVVEIIGQVEQEIGPGLNSDDID
jgi:hypothetical protein|tara:strand:+ start:800 stop:1114 length:315 start_codon:yes stop_codon:yes gene_type:complete